MEGGRAGSLLEIFFWACPLAPLGVGLAPGFADAPSRQRRDPPFGRPSASLTQSPSRRPSPNREEGTAP